MFFLSDISNAEFRRRKGSKDKVKRKKKLVIDDNTKDNIKDIRRNTTTTMNTINTARGVARETRNWLVLSKRLGLI